MSEKQQSKKKILFVCYGNMIRSQMAEGFARDFGGSFLDVYSAGLHPTGIVSEEAITVMADRGIDIGGHTSKGLNDVPLGDMDYVVSLSSRQTASFCPPSFSGTMIDCPIDDPIGRSFDFFVKARDQIEEKIKDLVKQLWKDSDKQPNG